MYVGNVRISICVCRYINLFVGVCALHTYIHTYIHIMYACISTVMDASCGFTHLYNMLGLVLLQILIVLWMTKSIGGDSLGWSSLFNDYPGNGSITVSLD